MANTHKGRRFFISTESVPDEDMNRTAFEALSYQEVEDVGKIGDLGFTENIVKYDLLKASVAKKQKGMGDAGDPTVEVARDDFDSGQIAMRIAAGTRYNWAFKVMNDDAPTEDYAGSIIYTRGLVAGVNNPGGGNEDFDLEIYTLGLNQKMIRIAPAPQVIGVNTVAPSITGAQVRVGYTLTAQEGVFTNGPHTFAYQWKHDASGNGTYADVTVGGTSKTYVPVVGDIADSLIVQVTATNEAGASAAALSLGTSAILAA